MIPALTGWLCGEVAINAREVMKIVKVEPDSIPCGFTITFASGLQLHVLVEESAEDERGGSE
jgi:hypothetical protein